MSEKLPTKLLSVREAITMTGLGTTTLYSLMDRGDLEYCRIGRTRRIPLASLERLIEANMVRRAKPQTTDPARMSDLAVA